MQYDFTFIQHIINSSIMGNNICIGDEDVCCENTANHTGLKRNLIHQSHFNSLNLNNTVIVNKSSISQEFIILHPPIGKGSFGSVFKAINRTTNIVRAVKRIPKKGKKLQQISQIFILKKLDHPNILRILDVFIDQTFIYLVMQYCEGGQLFQRIVQKKNITENQAKQYMKQLLSAISNCHLNKIMHRDLKPENIMFSSKQKNELKIIDFGAGTQYKQNQSTTLKVGSIYYVAPEVLKKNYNQKCDVWSLGVILYILLSGIPPFNGNSDNQIYQKIKSGKYSFPQKKWSKISKQATNLIDRMLEFNSQKRISARQALLHPWILSSTKEGNQNLFVVNEMESMKLFCEMNKFQSAVVAFISHNLIQTKSLQKLKEKFKKIDINKDGKLSFSQFKKCYLQNMPPLSEDQIRDIFNKSDQNDSGFIDYSQFISSALHKNIQQNQFILQSAFKLIDKDGDGYLDKSELMYAFRGLQQGIYDKMIKQSDLNGDQKISRSQFKLAMLNFKDTSKQKTKEQ